MGEGVVQEGGCFTRNSRSLSARDHPKNEDTSSSVVARMVIERFDRAEEFSGHRASKRGLIST